MCLSRPQADKEVQSRVFSLAVPRWKRVTSARKKERRPNNRPNEEGNDSDPGLASRRDSFLTATRLRKEVLSNQRELPERTKGRGPQRPRCAMGNGTQGPSRRGATGSCCFRGNCWRVMDGLDLSIFYIFWPALTTTFIILRS